MQTIVQTYQTLFISRLLQHAADLKEDHGGEEAAEHAKLQSKYEQDMSGFMKLSLSDKVRRSFCAHAPWRRAAYIVVGMHHELLQTRLT